jgi:hypothetical protein
MSDIAKLEHEIALKKDLVERRDRALKLSENFEFRKLFIEGYFKEDAARLVQMSTDPRLASDIRESCLEEARATGFMRRYLSDMVQMGHVAARELPDMYETLAELRAETAAE